MYFTALLFAELLLVTIVTASHFYGGSMTFNSRRNIDGSYKVELRFKSTYHTCYTDDYWTCKSGDCGNDVSTVIGQVDSSPNGNSWCQSEGVITKMVSTNSPFELLKSNCCWIYNTVTNSGDWRLLSYIDLGVRSDTSEPNRSPITTTLPYVRVPQNCPRRYNILAFDPDGDQVRCRFGLKQNNECGICNQTDGFTLDQHNCSLSYWQTWLLGVYSFELVLEDFPIHEITLSYTNQPSEKRSPISLIRNRRAVNSQSTTTQLPVSLTPQTTPRTTITTTRMTTNTMTPTTTRTAQTTTTASQSTTTTAHIITTTPPTTTTASPSTTTTAPITTTTPPKTTTASPSTTTTARIITTTPPTTTTASQSTTTTARIITTTPPTTTTASPSTTTTAPITTTTPPKTTTASPSTTTTAPITTTTPPKTTTASPSTTTTAPITTTTHPTTTSTTLKTTTVTPTTTTETTTPTTTTTTPETTTATLETTTTTPETTTTLETTTTQETTTTTPETTTTTTLETTTTTPETTTPEITTPEITTTETTTLGTTTPETTTTLETTTTTPETTTTTPEITTTTTPETTTTTSETTTTLETTTTTPETTTPEITTTETTTLGTTTPETTTTLETTTTTPQTTTTTPEITTTTTPETTTTTPETTTTTTPEMTTTETTTPETTTTTPEMTTTETTTTPETTTTIPETTTLETTTTETVTPEITTTETTTLETTTTTPEITTTETTTPETTTTTETKTPEITTTETTTPETTTTTETTTPEITTTETTTPEPTTTTTETTTPEPTTTTETTTPEITTTETTTPETTTTTETTTPEITTTETTTPETTTTTETTTPEITTTKTTTPEPRTTTTETTTPEPTTETTTPEITTTETTTTLETTTATYMTTTTTPPTTTTTTIITTTAPTPTPTTTTLPLSKIPLQFSLQVDSPAPSCIEGEYLPRFLHPTPHHGEHLQAHVNHELEIRVKAFAYFSRIIDVIISGPLNSTKYKTTTGEYVINWTPTTENYGQHFPFCFIAEGQNGSNIYHSEMRCVIAKVDAKGPVAHVTCKQNSMSVTIEKSSIEKLHGSHLRLIDPSCQVESNGTYVFANTLLNECGTQFEENNNELIFKNKIVTFDDPRNIITRKNQLEIEILCKYKKRTNLTMEFDTHRPSVSFSEKGLGTFSYQFEFYASNTFNNRMDPKSYPLEYNVGDKIYMQIEPVTPVLNTEVFLESCVATPYDNPNYPITYPIITNGCNIDETVQFFSSHKPYVQFEIEAFKFIGLHDQVFISCSIIICEANNPNTRCSQGCVNSTFTPPSHNHRKREAPTQTGSHFISQGPLRLKRSSASQVTVSQGLSLNLVVVASCLMAAVAMVCGVITYRSRGPSIRYQTVPSYEF